MCMFLDDFSSANDTSNRNYSKFRCFIQEYIPEIIAHNVAVLSAFGTIEDVVLAEAGI